MKRKTIKQFLTFGILFLFCSLFLYNCDNDFQGELNTPTATKELNFKRTIISEHYLKYHKPEVYRKLNELDNPTKNTERQEATEEYSFEYDLDHVQMLEAENFTQYSVLIRGERTDETHFENYILMEYSDGTHLQALLTFEKDFTPEGYIINHFKTEFEILDGDILLTSRCLGGFELVDIEITTGCYDVACTGLNGHLPGEYCPCGSLYDCEPPKVECTTETIQQWRACSQNDDGDPNDPSNGQTGGGGGDDGDNEDIPVIPLEIDYAQEIIDCINGNSMIGGPNYYVSNSQQSWLHGSSDPDIIPIYDHLQINSCNQEAQELAVEILDIMIGLDELMNEIENPSFDAIADPWLKALRELAKRLADRKDEMEDYLWRKLNDDLDELLIRALTKTALKLNMDADVDDDVEKDLFFQNDGKKGVGILLYEFATGTGPNIREFRDGDFYNQYFTEVRTQQIKDNFEDVLNQNGLTFEEFVTNGETLLGGNAFSPDHTSLIDSFEQHVNANWVQFFIGGTSIEYRPSSEFGYIDVKVINPTSRHSLILHLAENYPRDDYGPISLSTIYQYLYITLKVQ